MLIRPPVTPAPGGGVSFATEKQTAIDGAELVGAAQFLSWILRLHHAVLPHIAVGIIMVKIVYRGVLVSVPVLVDNEHSRGIIGGSYGLTA